MELLPDEKERLYRTLSTKFTLGELKRLSEFALKKHLEEITTSLNLSDIALELINWGETKEFMQELIEGALKINPRDLVLQELAGQAPKTLQPQQEPAQMHQESEVQAHVEAQSPIGKPVESPSEPININTKRHLISTNKRGIEQIVQAMEKVPPLLPLQFPLNTITELRNHINAAKESILNAYTLFLPEKEVFRDQCSFAIKQIQAADESIGKDFTESIHRLSIHTSARSLLELERTYFCAEAGKTITFLQEFASQTSSLLLRKKIGEKLQVLMKSLQDSDAFIDSFLENIQENKVNN